MKVGIDITPVIYQGTGVGVYTRELVRHLLAASTKTHFVLFASTLRAQRKLWQYLKTLAQYPNFSVKLYPFPPLVTELAWNKLHRLSVEKLVGNVDVFHAWDWQQPPARAAKLVTTIHDLTPLKFSQDHHPKTVTVHRRRLSWVAKEADAVITDSEAVKKDVIDLLGISSQKIHVVPLAASPIFSIFNQQSSRIRHQEIDRATIKYNLKGDYLLSVGTREPRKNLARVIEAFNLITHSLDNSISLAIVGQYGWGSQLDTRRLPRSKASRGYSLNAIKILGFVEPQDLPPLYAGAKALVYPSLYEGFGLPVLEAMSLGIPVVTSDRGSLEEVAGAAAVMVDPESSEDIAAGIKTVLADESSTLAKASLNQAQKFSWHHTAKKTMSVYRSIL